MSDSVKEIDFFKICRTCMSYGEMKPLYDDCTTEFCFVEKLMQCTFVEYFENDGLPTQICEKCLAELDRSYKFALKCEESDRKLREHLLKLVEKTKEENYFHAFMISKARKNKIAEGTNEHNSELTEIEPVPETIEYDIKHITNSKKIIKQINEQNKVIDENKSEPTENVLVIDNTKYDIKYNPKPRINIRKNKYNIQKAIKIINKTKLADLEQTENVEYETRTFSNSESSLKNKNKYKNIKQKENNENTYLKNRMKQKYTASGIDYISKNLEVTYKLNELECDYSLSYKIENDLPKIQLRKSPGLLNIKPNACLLSKAQTTQVFQNSPELPKNQTQEALESPDTNQNTCLPSTSQASEVSHNLVIVAKESPNESIRNSPELPKEKIRNSPELLNTNQNAGLLSTSKISEVSNTLKIVTTPKNNIENSPELLNVAKQESGISRKLTILNKGLLVNNLSENLTTDPLDTQQIQQTDIVPARLQTQQIQNKPIRLQTQRIQSEPTKLHIQQVHNEPKKLKTKQKRPARLQTQQTQIEPTRLYMQQVHMEYNRLQSQQNQPTKLQTRQIQNEPTRLQTQQTPNEPTRLQTQQTQNEPTILKLQQVHNELIRLQTQQIQNEPTKLHIQQVYNEPTGLQTQQNDPTTLQINQSPRLQTQQIQNEPTRLQSQQPQNELPRSQTQQIQNEHIRLQTENSIDLATAKGLNIPEKTMNYVVIKILPEQSNQCEIGEQLPVIPNDVLLNNVPEVIPEDLIKVEQHENIEKKSDILLDTKFENIPLDPLEISQILNLPSDTQNIDVAPNLFDQTLLKIESGDVEIKNELDFDTINTIKSEVSEDSEVAIFPSTSQQNLDDLASRNNCLIRMKPISELKSNKPKVLNASLTPRLYRMGTSSYILTNDSISHNNLEYFSTNRSNRSAKNPLCSSVDRIMNNTYKPSSSPVLLNKSMIKTYNKSNTRKVVNPTTHKVNEIIRNEWVKPVVNYSPVGRRKNEINRIKNTTQNTIKQESNITNIRAVNHIKNTTKNTIKQESNITDIRPISPLPILTKSTAKTYKNKKITNPLFQLNTENPTINCQDILANQENNIPKDNNTTNYQINGDSKLSNTNKTNSPINYQSEPSNNTNTKLYNSKLSNTSNVTRNTPKRKRLRNVNCQSATNQSKLSELCSKLSDTTKSDSSNVTNYQNNTELCNNYNSKLSTNSKPDTSINANQSDVSANINSHSNINSANCKLSNSTKVTNYQFELSNTEVNNQLAMDNYQIKPINAKLDDSDINYQRELSNSEVKNQLANDSELSNNLKSDINSLVLSDGSNIVINNKSDGSSATNYQSESSKHIKSNVNSSKLSDSCQDEQLNNENGIEVANNSKMVRKTGKKSSKRKQTKNIQANCRTKPPYECKRCNVKFPIYILLRDHFRKVAHRAAPKQCPICLKLLSYVYYKKHMRIHTNEKCACDICGKEFVSNGNLHRHKQTHAAEKPYKCDMCPKKFSQSTAMKVHRRLHTGETPYTCEICGVSFRSTMQLKSHGRTIHFPDEFIKGKSSNTRKDTKVYECNVCSKKIKSLIGLKHHKIFHEKKEVLCSVCGMLFHTKHFLNTHYIAVHTNEKPYQCSVCNKAFNTLSNMHRHKLTHSTDYRYRCTICQRGVHQPGQLAAHMRLHTNERPYPCKICGKAFKMGNDLMVHIRYHTGFKPYGCSVCKMRFYNTTAMRKHKLKHKEDEDN